MYCIAFLISRIHNSIHLRGARWGRGNKANTEKIIRRQKAFITIAFHIRPLQLQFFTTITSINWPNQYIRTNKLADFLLI